MKLPYVFSLLVLAIGSYSCHDAHLVSAAEPVKFEDVTSINPDFVRILSLSLENIPRSSLEQKCTKITMYREGNFRVVEFASSQAKSDSRNINQDDGSIAVTSGRNQKCGLNLKMVYDYNDLLVKTIGLR